MIVASTSSHPSTQQSLTPQIYSQDLQMRVIHLTTSHPPDFADVQAFAGGGKMAPIRPAITSFLTLSLPDDGVFIAWSVI